MVRGPCLACATSSSIAYGNVVISLPLSSSAIRISSERLSTAMRRSSVFSQPALSQELRIRLAE
jgi:hypothetical protein